MEIKEFRNKEEVEFHFFKKIDLNINCMEEDFKKLTSLFERYILLYRVIKILDESAICGMTYEESDWEGNVRKRKEFIVFENLFNLKEGQNVLVVKDNLNLEQLWIVENEVLDISFLDKCKKKLLKIYGIEFDSIKNEKVLTKEIIERGINKTFENIRRKKEIEERKRKAEEEKSKLKDVKKIEKYEKESIGEFKSFSGEGVEIDKNEIILFPSGSGQSKKYILDKNVNLVFDYAFLKENQMEHSYYYWRVLDIIETSLIEKQENYIKQEQKNKVWNKVYEVKFKENKAEINGGEVNKSKVNFILSRFGDGISGEKIKLLSDLSGMKVDILELKMIKVNDCEMDINISLIDEDSFDVEFMNITKMVNWDFLRKHFFNGGKTRSVQYSFSRKNFIDFVEEFGIDRQKFYDYFKRIVMIKNLKGNDKK